ncbi:hypothetical protein WIS52_08435 [Pseudonocardia nematodicida]|uniref:Secreted protein n=1 Tax=Pseudonocardia nematodicida TaxID=1206997 RepID=A0ABV1K7N4_9PSEU
MLKKAAFVTAGVTAGLLAVSPLAFAGDYGKEQSGSHHGSAGQNQINTADENRVSSQNGLVNVGDVNALNNANVLSCSLNNLDVAASVLGVLGGQAGNSGDDFAAGECSPGSTTQGNLGVFDN